MVVHQLMEDAHGRVAFQLPGDVVLRRFDAFPLLKDLRQHQFGGRPGVLLHAAAQKNFPFIGFAELLVAGLQHLQRFTHQLFILIDNPLEALHRFGVVALFHPHPAHHDRYPGAGAVRGGAFSQQRHRFIQIVGCHLLQGQFAPEVGDFATMFLFPQLHQPFSHFNSRLPVAGRLVNLQQLLQRAEAEIGLIHQLFEHVFRAVIQSGGHIIPSQLLHR